jgi:hypothetical protein
VPVEFNFRNSDELKAAGMGWLVDGKHPIEMGGQFVVLDGLEKASVPDATRAARS